MVLLKTIFDNILMYWSQHGISQRNLLKLAKTKIISRDLLHKKLKFYDMNSFFEGALQHVEKIILADELLNLFLRSNTK